MKKMFALCLVVLMLSAGSVFCKALIGYVDKGLLLDEYPEAKEVEAKLKEAQAERQEKIDVEKEKIKNIRDQFQAKLDKQKLSKEEETVKMRNFLEQELKPKLDELKQRHQKFLMELQTIEKKHLQKLKDKIDEAIEKAGNKKGLDIVLDKSAVFYGGIDITKDVIKELKK